MKKKLKFEKDYKGHTHVYYKDQLRGKIFICGFTAMYQPGYNINHDMCDIEQITNKMKELEEIEREPFNSRGK